MYWTAWYDLNTDRNSGMGLGPIPSRAISEYCYFWDMTKEESYFLYDVIRRVDTAYLAAYHKWQDSQKPKQTSS